MRRCWSFHHGCSTVASCAYAHRELSWTLSVTGAAFLPRVFPSSSMESGCTFFSCQYVAQIMLTGYVVFNQKIHIIIPQLLKNLLDLLLYILLQGTEMREGTNPSWFNPGEAVQAMLYCCQLAKRLYNPIPATDIGIITPYKKQVSYSPHMYA